MGLLHRCHTRCQQRVLFQAGDVNFVCHLRPKQPHNILKIRNNDYFIDYGILALNRGNSILIDSSRMPHNENYIFIFIWGKTKTNISFESESNTRTHRACSFNLNNVNYIIGGSSDLKQVLFNIQSKLIIWLIGHCSKYFFHQFIY